tara:strand:- start:1527 stop:1898 length:372 start_codon:yes stop_codon:yes gene_type:complete
MITKYKLSNNQKILCSIISTFWIYAKTNLELKSNNNNNTNNQIYNFFYHEHGTVCPFGVLCGKIMIFLGIIQILFLYYDNYDYIRTINIILLITSIIVASLMNLPLSIKLIPAYILQSLIIWY